MIRFINIDTNRVFNGDMPYIHWFEGQQSVDLIYTQRICVLSDAETIHVSVPENPVFHILDVSKIGQDEVIMNQVTYQDINNMYCYELDDTGIPYDQYYVHMLYFTASSSDAMEARENFFIDGQPYMMGADFYPEREELKINLANFGIEIPESVQRAIYPSNVHEEAKDNILLNRKYKELMMDYMTILGNKGSYESLLNSLHWFEYGDLLTIKEFWKHKEWERIIYNDQEFTQVLSEKSKHLLTNFAKTTYMGIYLAMQVEKRSKDADQDGDVIYDQETYTEHSRYDVMVNAHTDPAIPRELVSKKNLQRDTLTQHGSSGTFVSAPLDPHTDMTGANWKQSSEELATVERFIAEPVPALEKASYIWGRTDLAIKMALLGNFYETYFMPVHLDLIHATIEDIVYTNAIKVIPQGYLSRTDHIEHLHDVLCNISNGQTFLLGDVTVQADNQTPFHVNWKDTWNGTTYDYDLHTIIGVDEAFDHIIHDDDELMTWAVNRFQGVGAVIPMDFVIRASERVFGDHGEIVSQDLIHKVTMTINDGSEEWPIMEFNKLFEPDMNNNIHIKFNLLCTKDAEYDLRMQFYNTNGESYYKRIHFVVLDTRRAGLTVYKLKSIPKYSTIESLKLQGGKEAGDYLFSHFNLAEIQKYYTQYLPATTNQYLSTAVNGHGARLNHMLVVKGVFSVNTDPSNPTEQDFFDRLKQSPKTVEVLKNNYDIYPRYDGVDDGRIHLDTSRAKYYVLVSKEFDYILDQKHISNISGLEAGNKVILRNEYVFIPQKHYLEQLDKGKSINKYNKEDFTIYRDETACVVPDIRYLKYIESYEWVFRNASTLEYINLNSIKEPIVAPTKQVPLPAGYYDIIFRYKLANDPEGRINEVSLKSAFIQSDEYSA